MEQQPYTQVEVPEHIQAPPTNFDFGADPGVVLAMMTNMWTLYTGALAELNQFKARCANLEIEVMNLRGENADVEANAAANGRLAAAAAAAEQVDADELIPEFPNLKEGKVTP